MDGAAFLDLPIEPLFAPLLSPKTLIELRPRLDDTTADFLAHQLRDFREHVARPVVGACSLQVALDTFERKTDLVAAIRLGASRVLLHHQRLSRSLQGALLDSRERISRECHEAASRQLGLRAGRTLVAALGRADHGARRLSDLLTAPALAVDPLRLQRLFHDPESLLDLSRAALLADGLSLICVATIEEEAESPLAAPSAAVLRGLIEATWEACLAYEQAALRWSLSQLRALPPQADGTDGVAQIQADLAPEARFRGLWGDWKSATRHLSHPRQIVGHPAYQAIVRMGREALPFILRDLRSEEPDFWGPALTQITRIEEHPLPEHAQTIQGVAGFWLALAERHGWEAA
jgi:hypothetical protein